MKKTSTGFSSAYFIVILLADYFFASIAMYNGLMDPQLLPRFTVLTCTFLVLTIIISFGRKQGEFLQTIYQAPLILGLGLYLIYLLSWMWSSVVSEAILESQRTLLFVLTLLFSSYAINIRPDFEELFIKTSLLIGIIAIGMAIPQVISAKISNLNFKNIYWVNSISGHKNLFSSLLFLLGVFALLGITKLTKHWKYLAIGNTCLYLGFILFLQTRAVWMGILSGGIVFVLFMINGFKSNSKRKLLIACGIGVSVMIICIWTASYSSIGKHYLERVQFWNYASSASGNERLILWEKTMCMLQNKWLLGCGAGQWQFHVTECTYSGLEWSLFKNYTFQRPHNDFVWVLAEVGVIGFLFYLLMWGTTLWQGVKYLFNPKTDRWPVIVYVSGIIGFLTISFFDFPKERIEHNILAAHLIVFLWHKTGVSWNWKKWKLPKGAIFVIWGLLIFNVFIAAFRWKGEYHALKMNSYYRIGNFEGTIREARKAYSFFYTVDVYSMPIRWYEGGASFQLQSPDHGVPFFEEAYHISSFNALIINNLATGYAISGDYASAVKYYEESFRLAPSYDPPKYNMIQILMSQKNYKQARAVALTIKDDSAQKQFYINAIEAALNQETK